MQIVWHLPVSSSGWANIEKGLSLSKVLSCGGFWPQSKNKSLFQKLYVKSQVVLWMCVCVCVCVCARARAQPLSHVWLFATPWTAASQALCPWDSPGKNPGVGCHFLLQGIFPIQGLNPRLLHSLHWQQIPHPSAVWRSVKEFYRASRIPVTQSNVLTYPYVHCQAMRRKDRTVGSYSKLLTKTISY